MDTFGSFFFLLDLDALRFTSSYGYLALDGVYSRYEGWGLSLMLSPDILRVGALCKDTQKHLPFEACFAPFPFL